MPDLERRVAAWLLLAITIIVVGMATLSVGTVHNDCRKKLRIEHPVDGVEIKWCDWIIDPAVLDQEMFASLDGAKGGIINFDYGYSSTEIFGVTVSSAEHWPRFLFLVTKAPNGYSIHKVPIYRDTKAIDLKEVLDKDIGRLR